MVSNKRVLKQANAPIPCTYIDHCFSVGNRLLAMEAGKSRERYLVATTIIQMVAGTTLTFVQRMGERDNLRGSHHDKVTDERAAKEDSGSG